MAATSVRADLAERLLQRGPPDARVDLGALRVGAAGLADDLSLGRIDDDDLGGLGGGVDAGDEA